MISLRRAAALAASGLLLLTAEGTAGACATCGCGDPTLTTLGGEKPYANRIRAGAELRYRTDSVGTEGLNHVAIEEVRLDLYGAWAPTERIFLQLALPLLRRGVEDVNLSKATGYGLGDAEVRAKFFVAQDRKTQPRHLFAVLAGLRVPTAPTLRRDDGTLLPGEAQPGSGTFDPILGLAYAWFPRPFALFASTHVVAPVGTTDDRRANASLRTSVSLQYEVVKTMLAARVSLDTRLDGKAYEDGRRERDSGGFIAYGSPEVLYTPRPDLTLFARVQLPFLDLLVGAHDEGPILATGLGYDFR